MQPNKQEEDQVSSFTSSRKMSVFFKTGAKFMYQRVIRHEVVDNHLIITTKTFQDEHTKIIPVDNIESAIFITKEQVV